MKSINFINLTPHSIKIKRGEEIVEVKPSGVVARVSTREDIIGEIDGIPIIKRRFGEVEGLPKEKEGVILIVSSLVLSAVSGRKDVMAPDTGATAIRNSEGQISYVTRLVLSFN